jgi:thymidylate kinase
MVSRKNQKIIIFEGVDRCGKTNIALKLSNILKIPYFKNHLEKKYWNSANDFANAIKYDQPYFLQFLEQTGYSVIIDRSYPSEYVYSQIYNRKTDYTLIDEIDRRYAQLGASLMFLYRTDYSKVCNQDDLVSEDKFALIHKKYIEFSQMTKCRHAMINVDDENLNREIEEILGFLNDKTR